MASQEAWRKVNEIVEALALAGKLDSEDLDNLKGRIAVALDDAWCQGRDDAEMKARLEGMGLAKGL